MTRQEEILKKLPEKISNVFDESFIELINSGHAFFRLANGCELKLISESEFIDAVVNNTVNVEPITVKESDLIKISKEVFKTPERPSIWMSRESIKRLGLEAEEASGLIGCTD